MVRKTKEEAEATRQQIIDAARLVFHENGVSRSSLEKVAHAAGVTRGAVYWHFADKAELFMALRESGATPLAARIDPLLLSETIPDPLDAIEQALQEFFKVLDDSPEVRQLFEIMALRCEYVGEFAKVHEEVNKPAAEFYRKVEIAYRRAADKGTLRDGLDPRHAALDTFSFTGGLFHQLLGKCHGEDIGPLVPAMIRAHVALRRR